MANRLLDVLRAIMNSRSATPDSDLFSTFAGYKITAAEVAAGVTTVSFVYLPGHLYRYGSNTVPGTTDMSSALQAAVNQSAQAGGAPAYVPINNHNISSNITVPAFASITGAGYGSLITFTGAGVCFSSSNAVELSWRRSLIEGLFINTTSGAYAIQLSNIADFEISRCLITGFSGAGIRLTGTAGQGTGDISIHNNQLVSNVGDGLMADGVNNIDAVSVHDNHFYGNGRCSIYCVVSGKGWSVRGNTLEAAGAITPLAEVYLNNVSGIDFSGNYLEVHAAMPAIIVSDTQSVSGFALTGNLIQMDATTNAAIILGNGVGGLAQGGFIKGNSINGAATVAVNAKVAANCQIGPNDTPGMTHLVVQAGCLGIEEVTQSGTINHSAGRAGAIFAAAYSASITPNAALGEVCVITVTNATAFTINPPTNLSAGQFMTFQIVNNSGGAMGAITWTGYKLAGSFTNPIANFMRLITFYYDGGSLRETSRTAADMAA